MAQTITGGCLCGAVRYKISGDLIFSGKCYCEDCRKSGSTGHSSVLAVPEPSVSMTGKLTEFKKMGTSGQPITRKTCPTCAHISSSPRPGAGVLMINASSSTTPRSPSPDVSGTRAPSWDQPRG
jgi:hypothetical protein